MGNEQIMGEKLKWCNRCVHVHVHAGTQEHQDWLHLQQSATFS